MHKILFVSHLLKLISITNFLSSTFYINDHFRRDCTTGDLILEVLNLIHQWQSCQDVYLFIMLNVCLLCLQCCALISYYVFLFWNLFLDSFVYYAMFCKPKSKALKTFKMENLENLAMQIEECIWFWNGIACFYFCWIRKAFVILNKFKYLQFLSVFCRYNETLNVFGL